jgi:hypothetical protein
MSATTDADVNELWVEYVDAALVHLEAQHRLQRPLGDDGDADAADAAATGLEAARERFGSTARGSTGGFGALAGNARLASDDLELLAFVLACELAAGRQRLVSYVQDDLDQTRLTLQTAGVLLGGLERCAAAIGPGSRLRRAALLEVVGDGPWARQFVVPPASLVWALLGDPSPDADLPHGARVVEVDGGAAREADVPALVVVYGSDRVRRREAARAALGGERFLLTPTPADDRAWAAVVREATVTGCAVLVELDVELPEEGRRWIQHADHLAWGVTAARELPVADLFVRPFVELEAVASDVTDAEWASAFPGELDLGRRHRLTPQQLERVHQIYAARGGDIDAAVRRLLAGPLEDLAVRVRPRHSWDDLVLPPDRIEQLHAIVARYRDAAQVYDRWGFSATPSRGLVALFAGPSGTGKTLSAEVLAGELGLDMFRIDLATMVSKYIGETEKNLDALFDAAGVGNVVLFFDEADALFGKRTAVQDSHDRYANVGVSYLLQRLETFDGVVVLATNFQQSIDEAFLRRIHSRVDFTRPDEPERLFLWRHHLPPEAPVDDLDLPAVAARLEFTGGQIRNAAVQAAFYAAAAGKAIGMEELLRAAAEELHKAGRLVQPETFGDWYPSVSG